MPRSSTKKKKSLYGVHPGGAMMQKWIAEIPEKTGKALEQGNADIRKRGTAEQKAPREWLKQEHGLGTNTAWWLAERADENSTESVDDDPEAYLRAAEKYVEEMFAGAKAGLRQIYDKLLEVGLGIADDVKACPCKTIVP